VNKFRPLSWWFVHKFTVLMHLDCDSWVCARATVDNCSVHSLKLISGAGCVLHFVKTVSIYLAGCLLYSWLHSVFCIVWFQGGQQYFRVTCFLRL